MNYMLLKKTNRTSLNKSLVDPKFNVLNRYNSRICRTLNHPIEDGYSADKIRKLADELTVLLAPKIHLGIHALKGRGPMHLVADILRYRARHYSITRFDLEKAYQSVDIDRLLSLLKKAGVPVRLISQLEIYGAITDKYIDGSSFRGLPQGYATSPILFAFFMSPILKRLERDYEHNALLWVDDGFICTPPSCRSDPISDLMYCLKKSARQTPILSRSPRKRPRTYHRRETIQLFGLRLIGAPDHKILPSDKSLAISYVRSLLTLSQLNLPEPTRRFLDTLCPNITSRTKSAGHHDDRIQHDLIGLPGIHEHHTRRIAFERTLDAQWDEPSSQSFADCALAPSLYDWPYGFSYSSEQQQSRLELLSTLVNQLPERLSRIIAKQNEPTAPAFKKSMPQQGRQAALYRLLVEELWATFIFFHPFDTLTATYYSKRRLNSPGDRRHAMQLYFNELKIINRLCLLSPLLEDLCLPIPLVQIQRILRGFAHAKWHNLTNPASHKSVPISESAIDRLGAYYWRCPESMLAANELVINDNFHCDRVLNKAIAEVSDNTDSGF